MVGSDGEGVGMANLSGQALDMRGTTIAIQLKYTQNMKNINPCDQNLLGLDFLSSHWGVEIYKKIANDSGSKFA